MTTIRERLEAHAARCREARAAVELRPELPADLRDLSGANLRRADLSGASLGGAKLGDAYLSGANLSGAYLYDAYLGGADLSGANLDRAKLHGAYLRGANLGGASLDGAKLEGADLEGANLDGAKLEGANLEGANLEGAKLECASLEGAKLDGAILRRADLSSAILPDGRKWEEYRADHLAGICDDPDVRRRALEAWGNHQWSDCPMHAALGIDGLGQIDDATKRLHVAAWVALYDAGLLERPGGGA